MASTRRRRISQRGPGLLRSFEDALYAHAWLLFWFAGVLLVSMGIAHRWGGKVLLGEMTVYLWIAGFGIFFGACLMGVLRTGQFWARGGSIEPSPSEWCIALTGMAVILGPFARAFVVMGFGLLVGV